MGTSGIFLGTPRRDGLLLLGVGVVVLSGSWFQYEDFVALESGARDSIRLNFLMQLLYVLFGKWGVVATLVAAGCALLGVGAKKLILGR